MCLWFIVSDDTNCGLTIQGLDKEKENYALATLKIFVVNSVFLALSANYKCQLFFHSLKRLVIHCLPMSNLAIIKDHVEFAFKFLGISSDVAEPNNLKGKTCAYLCCIP